MCNAPGVSGEGLKGLLPAYGFACLLCHHLDSSRSATATSFPATSGLRAVSLPQAFLESALVIQELSVGSRISKDLVGAVPPMKGCCGGRSSISKDLVGGWARVGSQGAPRDEDGAAL